MHDFLCEGWFTDPDEVNDAAIRAAWDMYDRSGGWGVLPVWPRPLRPRERANGRSFTKGSCSGGVRDIQRGCRAASMKSSERARAKALAALVVGASCVVSGVALSGFAGAASTAPQGPATEELKAAVASANKKGSVRVTVHFFSGKTTGELVQDSARRSAIQTVAIGKERVSILLLNGLAYFSGNLPGLTSYFGLPKPVATTLSGRWISVSPTDSGFQSVTAGLTLSSALREASPTGSVTKGKQKKVGGQMTQSISGTGSANVPPTTLFVATRGNPLPVEAVASRGSGKGISGEIVTFSRWGEKVHVPTPTDPIPISTLSAPPTSTG